MKQCIFQSHLKKIWGHQFQLGVLGGIANITLYNTYFGLKCVLFICNLENYKKDPLLIIFGAHMVEYYYFGSGCNTFFECLLKHNSLIHQTWEIDINNCKNIEESFKQLKRLGLSFRFFQLSNLFQLFNNQLCQDSSVSFFWKGE